MESDGGTGGIRSQSLARHKVPATAIWYRNNGGAWLNAQHGMPWRRLTGPPGPGAASATLTCGTRTDPAEQDRPGLTGQS
jgi:hypothetical protein